MDWQKYVIQWWLQWPLRSQAIIKIPLYSSNRNTKLLVELEKTKGTAMVIKNHSLCTSGKSAKFCGGLQINFGLQENYKPICLQWCFLHLR